MGGNGTSMWRLLPSPALPTTASSRAIHVRAPCRSAYRFSHPASRSGPTGTHRPPPAAGLDPVTPPENHDTVSRMANPFAYEGKRVVVTGGSSGLGAALVRLLADLGAASITVLDRQEPVEPIPADRLVTVDLSDPADIDRVAGELRGSVDVLFNNA